VSCCTSALLADCVCSCRSFGHRPTPLLTTRHRVSTIAKRKRPHAVSRLTLGTLITNTLSSHHRLAPALTYEAEIHVPVHHVTTCRHHVRPTVRAVNAPLLSASCTMRSWSCVASRCRDIRHTFPQHHQRGLANVIIQRSQVGGGACGNRKGFTDQRGFGSSASRREWGGTVPPTRSGEEYRVSLTPG